jgi:hypothetical protein
LDSVLLVSDSESDRGQSSTNLSPVCSWPESL